MEYNFTVEEVNLICVFAGKSRGEVIEDIEKALPYLDDLDMAELSNRTIGKLRNMTDEEFNQLELVEADQNVTETGILPDSNTGMESLFFHLSLSRE